MYREGANRRRGPALPLLLVLHSRQLAALGAVDVAAQHKLVLCMRLVEGAQLDLQAGRRAGGRQVARWVGRRPA